MPKVSIIMPVYNKERYLRESLKSVLNQSFSDFELIVVNDGSTDNCLAIIQEFARKDSRIKVFSQKNKGVSAARNLGLEKAKGQWIQFLDCDDSIMPDYIEKCFIKKNVEQYDIIFSDFKKNNILNGESQIISSERKEDGNSKSILSEFIRKQFNNGFYGFLSNKLINCKLIKNNLILFREDITLAEDLQFMIQLYRKCKRVCYIDTLSYVYYIRDDNFSFNRNINYYTQLEIILDLLGWITEENQYEEYKQFIDNKITNYAYTILFETNENHGDILKACKTINNINRINGHINDTYLKGFKKIIIICLCKRRYITVEILFRIRNSFRAIYRKVFVI